MAKAPTKKTAKPTSKTVKAAAKPAKKPAKKPVVDVEEVAVEPSIAEAGKPMNAACCGGHGCGCDGNKRWARKLLFILLAVFAVVFAVNGLMATLAVKTNTGLVTDNAYEKGLDYNKTLAEKAAEMGLGWKVVRNEADFPARIVYTLSDKDGVPLGGAFIHVKAERPMNDVPAFEMDLREDSDGTYVAPVAWPQKGQWELVTTIVQGGRSLVGVERVDVE